MNCEPFHKPHAWSGIEIDFSLSDKDQFVGAAGETRAVGIGAASGRRAASGERAPCWRGSERLTATCHRAPLAASQRHGRLDQTAPRRPFDSDGLIRAAKTRRLLVFRADWWPVVFAIHQLYH